MWKPDRDGPSTDLVIILPSYYKSCCSVSVDGETGEFHKIDHGGPIFRFDKTGGSYCGGSACEVKITCGGLTDTYDIPNPSKRCGR